MMQEQAKLNLTKKLSGINQDLNQQQQQQSKQLLEMDEKIQNLEEALHVAQMELERYKSGPQPEHL